MDCAEMQSRLLNLWSTGGKISDSFCLGFILLEHDP